jgi:hypothetical protein
MFRNSKSLAPKFNDKQEGDKEKGNSRFHSNLRFHSFQFVFIFKEFKVMYVLLHLHLMRVASGGWSQ